MIKTIEELRKNSLVVCAMTSWKKRISNCHYAITKLLNQTEKPDRVYLTLSSDEFPKKEKELPKDLVELSKMNDAFIINWVKENTKSMKKVLPVLQYLNDDDIIINCDDDMDFPEDFIECRLNEFIDNGAVNPISGSNMSWHYETFGSFKTWIIVCTSIFQKKMFNGWEKIVDDELISTYNDDVLYTLLFLMNGYKIIPTKILTTMDNPDLRRIKSINENDAMGKMGICKPDDFVFSLFSQKFFKVFNYPYNDLAKRNAIIQTLWTKPLILKHKDKLKQNMIMAYASAISIKKQGYYLKLYTDKIGYDLVKDFPYDEVIVLDNLDDLNPSLFATIKFLALEREPLDVVHLDYDIVLSKPCIDFKGKDVLTQNEENYASYGKKEKQFLYANKVPKLISKYGLSNNPYCFGVIGFNNQQLKDIFIENYKEAMNLYRNVQIPSNLTLDFLFEQAFLPKVVEYHKFKPGFITSDFKKNFIPLSGGGTYFSDSNIGYTHYWGDTKYRSCIQESFLQQLSDDDKSIIERNLESTSAAIGLVQINTTYQRKPLSQSEAIKRLKRDILAGKIVKVRTAGGFIWKKIK